MTVITQQIRPNPSTDAEFRDCVQKIRDGITGLGWVRTSDTGQIDPATVLKPTAVSTVAGYDIFRMADSLQATAPFFLKVEYGAPSGSASYFAWWITVGTGTNGAGTLTGNVSTRAIFGIGLADAGTLRTCTFTGTPSRLAIMLFENHAGAANTMALVIERSHADDGSDTGERVDILATGYSTTVNFQMLPTIGQFATPAVQSAQLPVPVPISGSGLKGTDVGIFALFPNMAGPLRNPMIGFLEFVPGDIAVGSEVPITMYGTTRIYRNPPSHHSATTMSMLSRAMSSLFLVS